MTRILAPVVVAVLALALWNAARGAAADNARCHAACVERGHDDGRFAHGACACTRMVVVQLNGGGAK